MSVSVVALAPAEAKEAIANVVSKVEKITLDLKGVATNVDDLQGLLIEYKPDAVLITSAFADKAEAIRSGILAVNKDVTVVAIPEGKTGPEAIEWLKTQFAK
ncbi:uncharacterized protein B0I36DRAFT_364981 [Microdochium trichocladiopsis]|uniref:Uncharacterized protein n=1 Tax=Microdochium trichocladiopsis TaxID=1682393 RepID=A0A9P9BS09_9PEZI|nr:uncharacterized protein B0I36DRAFT_364981 [Microdochium trichocladiopsis]KAH7027835.1 hypothetical protein B0I36DRAFT_364981 [Microdochium trichocladiopsis]